VTPFPGRVWQRTEGGNPPPGPGWGDCRSCRKPPAHSPVPCWLQRLSLVRWCNPSTGSCPSCAYPYPSILAGSLGEAPSGSACIPASRIDGQSRPGNVCQLLIRGDRNGTDIRHEYLGWQEFLPVRLKTNPPSVKPGFWSTDRTPAVLIVGSTPVVGAASYIAPSSSTLGKAGKSKGIGSGTSSHSGPRHLQIRLSHGAATSQTISPPRGSCAIIGR
jgi:hypothetical protein